MRTFRSAWTGVLPDTFSVSIGGGNNQREDPVDACGHVHRPHLYYGRTAG